MPSDTWDEEARWRASPALTVLGPALTSLVVQVLVTAAVALWQRVGPAAAAVAVALAAASALCLLAAGRWPGPTVAIIAALALADLFLPPVAGPPFVALAFGIIGAVVRSARVWAYVSVGAVWLAALMIAGTVDAAWHPFRVALATVGVAACFGVGEAIRARLAGAAQRRAQLAERRRTVEQEERARIARELHDVLAHSLSQISVQSGMGLHLFDREPERAREALASIRGLSATGLDEVRGVLAFLRGDERSQPVTAPLTPQPQLTDLPALVAARNGLGLTVTLDDRLRDEHPPGAVQTTAYRIVQEALTNVVRHSAASHAHVDIDHDGDALVIAVTDDGTGLPDSVPVGGGIRGMRERAVLAGGALELAPASRQGTVLTARLPWAGPA